MTSSPDSIPAPDSDTTRESVPASTAGSVPVRPSEPALAATSPPPAGAPPARRTRSAGHVVAIVLGCLALLPALGALTGGVGIAVARGVAADDDGYFNVTPDRFESAGVAIATDDVWFDGDDGDDDVTPWILNWLDLDLRLRVDGAATTDDVFVGIAHAADVEDYLADSRHTMVVDMDHDRPVYEQLAGERAVAPPASQDFWVASASGTGEQELNWDARGGRWSIVVMNTDGSPGVAADVEVGARSGALTPVMVTLLIGGGFATLLSVGLIVIGVRGRRNDPSGRPPFTGTLPPPLPGTMHGTAQGAGETAPEVRPHDGPSAPRDADRPVTIG